LLCSAALAAAVCLLPVAHADNPQKAVSDQEFVQMASAAGLAEVNMGRAALEHATRDDVKGFAKRIVDDHTKANTELNRIADAKRMTPAATMDAKHQDMMRTMTRLTGAEFDRQFMQAQVRAHEKAVALFESESKNGQDPQLKEFATKTLPTLREHLQMAQKIAGNNGNRPGNSGRSDTNRSQPDK